MTRELKSVRVDAELLAELERLARERVVPVTFADQVDAGLRLLVRQATDEQARYSARLIAADRQRAQEAHHRLHEHDR
jgi:hypothetical protein